jgi:histone acetyltransferase
VLIPANSTITESVDLNSSPHNHVKKKKHEHRISNTSSEVNFDQTSKRINPLSAQSSCDANSDNYYFANRIDGYYGDNDREGDDEDDLNEEEDDDEEDEEDDDDERIENFEDDEEDEILNAERNANYGDLEEQSNREREESEDADLNEGDLTIANRNRKHRMQHESANDSIRVNTFAFSPNNNNNKQLKQHEPINDESSDDRSYNEHIISVPVLSVMQSAIDTNAMMGNDLSDDEVKEYHLFKETLDDDSHV